MGNQLRQKGLKIAKGTRCFLSVWTASVVIALSFGVVGCVSTMNPYDPLMYSAPMSSPEPMSPVNVDVPVLVDTAKVTYARARQDTPVLVRVAEPNLVFDLATTVLPTQYTTGTVNHSRYKLGEGLRNASSLLWNRYLEVREDSPSGIPVIEMSIVNPSGSATMDMSEAGNLNSGVLARHTGKWSFTVRCRLFSSDGRNIDEFLSVQSRTLNSVMTQGSTDAATRDLIAFSDASAMMTEAFSEVLTKFFASERVLVALGQAPAQSP